MGSPAGTAAAASAAPVNTFANIYMVGDNPRADVALARNAGRPWWSFLVRTGVYTGLHATTGAQMDNDPHNPADYVVQGVGEAVDTALRL